MPSITLFEGSIGDQVTTLALTVRRDLDNQALPIELIIDDDTLRLTLDHAAQLANAGRRIERALNAKEAPKEAAAVFQHKIGFENGDISIFELGVVADPIGVYVAWDKKRIALGVDRCSYLLFVLARVGEAVDDTRRGSQPPDIPAPPPVGRRWETWSPRFDVNAWRPEGWI